MKFSKNILSIGVVLLGLFTLTANAAGKKQIDPEILRLQKIALAKVKATAKDPVTPQKIMQKVREAAEMIQKEGPAAFPKFRGDSDFIFNGTYTYISCYDDQVLYVHPLVPSIEGGPVMHIKDVQGNMIMAKIMDSVDQSPVGEAWESYWWPNPGHKKPIAKVAFSKKIKSVDGKVYLISCATINYGLDEVRKLHAEGQ